MTPSHRQNVGPHPRPSMSTKPMFHRVFAAEPSVVRKTLVDIRARFGAGLDEDTMGRLELVLAEVLNNVAEHAVDVRQGTSIHLCIVRQDAGFACAITDDGVSLPQECLQPRNLPQDGATELPEGGFGWYLIQDLTQALCYYRERHRNFLAFSVPFDGVERAH
ncbi:ATP-binding protein [Paracoccus homiensis]|uniref:Serine/threonine-protein kinase RsbW n=1 Tax=Paracoccus homiensis TaxID=364199 RepID=A0A1H9YX02_9RHOB|nr:ATP-binding protein [Paracoccus homiensis]SES73726.1 serine/threonine-protein kinase RsbW [Paracoccus homiensis]